MPTFKGTKMGLAFVSVEGSRIKARIHYTDEAGTVHGTCEHSFLAEDGPMLEAAQSFLVALHRHIEALHFTDLSELPMGAVETRKVGIAEALKHDSAGSEELPDGFESVG